MENKLRVWYNKIFKQADKDTCTDPAMAMDEFKKQAIGINTSIGADVIATLTVNYQDKEILQLQEAWHNLSKNLKSEQAMDFAQAIDAMHQKIVKLKNYLDNKMAARDTETNVQNLNTWIAELQKLQEVRAKLLLATNELYQASDQLRHTDAVTKLISRNNLSIDTFLKLHKLERNLLYTICRVNYFLVPVAPYVLPIVFTLGGGIAGYLLGLTVDAAAGGTSLGLIGLTGSVLGCSIGGLVGRFIAWDYGRIDNMLRVRLAIAEREIALCSSANLQAKAITQQQVVSKALVEPQTAEKTRVKLLDDMPRELHFQPWLRNNVQNPQAQVVISPHKYRIRL